MARGDARREHTSNLFFRTPPRHPDARDVYLGGCGLITSIRGLFYLVEDPQAALFTIAGQAFILTWAWIWVLGGLFVLGVAFTGHKWPELDRYAAFSLMMIWWVWGFMYLVSVTIDSGRRLADAYAGGISVITGLVLTAGVIVSIRKTQEIELRQIAVGRIRELEVQARELAEDNERLRLVLQKAGLDDG